MMVNPVSTQPDFMEGLNGQLLINESMSGHTSWRTGGIADYFYTPANKADLIQLLRQVPDDIPVHWIGLGSNLLIRDAGVRGVVIRTSRGLAEIEISPPNKIYVEAGVSCAKVARMAARNDLTGVEFLAGVPGSFGGALAMNAGAFGGEVWNWVEYVEGVNRHGKCTMIFAKNVNFGYRQVTLPVECWMLGGVLALEIAQRGYNGKDRIRSLLDKRSATQPIQSANAGSVFRNPPGDFAARLIEAAGLKGLTIGNASISTVHANFIVNNGSASAADIEQLIHTARDRVRQHSGIELALEVRIMGEME